MIQPPPYDLGEVFFEMTALGDTMRVAAVHAETGTEVVVIGSTHAARYDLERLALRKLQAKLKPVTCAAPQQKGRLV